MHSLIATAWPDQLRIRVNELQPRLRSWSEKSCTVSWGRERAFGKRVIAIGCEWLLLVQGVSPVAGPKPLTGLALRDSGLLAKPNILTVHASHFRQPGFGIQILGFQESPPIPKSGT